MKKPEAEYSSHEAANIFPLDGEHFDSLADDIKANGQQIPIELLDGKILDGRRRYRACRIAGVEPKFREVQIDDPVAYVLSLNLHRRHLTPSQAAMCAQRAREIYDRRAKERQQVRKGNQAGATVENLPQLEPSKARDEVGKAFGVSGKSVDHAKRVIEKAIPEVVKAVDEGRMAVSTAAILATEPEEVQRAEAENPKRSRTYQSVSKPLAISVEKPQEERAEVATDRTQTELFAINKADVSITQLRGIPKSNKFRKVAFSRVISWIESQR